MSTFSLSQPSQTLPSCSALKALSDHFLDHEVHVEDVHLDIEEEQSIIPDLVAEDFESSEDASNNITATSSKNSTIKASQLDSSGPTLQGSLPKLHDVAKGTLLLTDVFSLMQQCSRFLVDKKLVQSADEFFSDVPLSTAPSLICLWILSECDTIDINNNPLGPDVIRSSFSHAQKMRACMTYTFGRLYGLGKQAWTEHRGPGGKIDSSGNPSVSELVSRYMLSLHRRKIQKGDVSTSARAMDISILERLYDYNFTNPEVVTEVRRYRAGNRREPKSLHDWGGPMARNALHAIYLIAFFCLLRIDEVLKIRLDQIEVDGDKVTLTLWYRKTHQYGDIKPFVLHCLNDYDSHLCPVRALANWIKMSKISQGYLFRRIVSGDRPSASDKPMTSEQFLLMYRHNLMDIGVEPGPYGTHSFRRGGCQYLASVRRWPLRRICEWGGWSQEFTNMTIVKYLISWNDNPNESRDDFLNPKQQ
ncbi:hypothetical protein CVT24_010015, partial [Panaeolus cyanescens]